MNSKKQLLAWTLLTLSIAYSSFKGHTFESTLLNWSLFAFVGFCEFTITNKKHNQLEAELEALNAKFIEVDKRIDENRSYVTSLKVGHSMAGNSNTLKRAV